MAKCNDHSTGCFETFQIAVMLDSAIRQLPTARHYNQSGRRIPLPASGKWPMDLSESFLHSSPCFHLTRGSAANTCQLADLPQNPLGKAAIFRLQVFITTPLEGEIEYCPHLATIIC